MIRAVVAVLASTAMVACVRSRPPEPLFPPQARVEIPAPHAWRDLPSDCPEADVLRGELVPVPVDDDGAATCDATIVAPGHAARLQDAADALPEVVEALRRSEELVETVRVTFEADRLTTHADLVELRRRVQIDAIVLPVAVAGAGFVAFGVGFGAGRLLR